MKRSVCYLLILVTLICAVGSLSFGISASEVTEEFETAVRIHNGGTYPRLTSLSNGAIEAYYETGFRHSFDSGNTFSANVSINKHAAAQYVSKNGVTHTLSRANHHALELSDGSMMVAYRSHSNEVTSGEFYTSIRVMTRGNYTGTYANEVVVTEQLTDSFNGYWEPFLVQLDEDTVAMYYADDLSPAKSPAQQYIMVVLYDMNKQTWGTPKVVVNAGETNGRDGMPMVARLTDGNYVMAIESHAWKSTGHVFVVQLWFSADGMVWDGGVIVAAAGTRYGLNKYRCAAPCVTVLPDGRIAVSYQDNYSGRTSRTYENTEAIYNSIPVVILSKEAVTYDPDKKTSNLVAAKNSGISSSFENKPLKFGANADIEDYAADMYGIWNSVFYGNGYLYCVSSVGYNTSTTTRKNLGVYLCRMKVDGNLVPNAATVEKDYAEVKIKKADQLLHLMNDPSVWSSDYILMNDIDLGDYKGSMKQTTIGFATGSDTFKKYFDGTFDGDLHAIKGININNTSADRFTGLFGCTANGAAIKDLTIYGTVSSSSKYCGAFVGYSENTVLSGLVSYVKVSGVNNVGGIAGRVYVGGIGSKVENCTNYGTVTATAENAGGIIGSLETKGTTCKSDTYVKGCVNNSAVSGTKNVGGIAGALSHFANDAVLLSVESCKNHGSVTATSADGCAGGIAGLLQTVGDLTTPRKASASVKACVNDATVKGQKYTAGIIGSVIYDGSKKDGNNVSQITALGSCTIAECINSGEVGAGEALCYVGGIVGRALGNNEYKVQIERCRSLGNVTGAKKSYDMGGIAGVAMRVDIADCEVRANVVASSDAVKNIGGIAGRMEKPASMKNCYFHGTSSFNAIAGALKSGCTEENNYYSVECGTTDTLGTAVRLASNKDSYSGLGFYTVWVDTPNGPKLVFDTTLKCGDNNGDGRVNSLDAAIMSRYLAEWSGYSDKLSYYSADIDRNGVINSKDAAILARHIAGWSEYAVLPVE